MIPDGWTDDLDIVVAPEHTIDELVDFVLEHERRRGSVDVLFEVLTTTFGLSFEDARLAVDRVAGGRVRAASGLRENAPNASKDPVAHVSYRRALGTPAPPRRPTVSAAWGELLRMVETRSLGEAIGFARSLDFTGRAEPQEREASVLWIRAAEAAPGGVGSATTAAAALRLLELATALAGTRCDGRTLDDVLLQVGVAISSVAEVRIAQRGPEGCALQGTPAWFDAIRLGDAAAELSKVFGRRGDARNEGAALDLRGRIVTSLLGHCRHRVGVAMLDSVSHYRRIGENGRAASMCEAIISDFQGLAVERESMNAEDLLGLRQLVTAIDIHCLLQGSGNAAYRALRDRCNTLLGSHAGALEC